MNRNSLKTIRKKRTKWNYKLQANREIKAAKAGYEKRLAENIKTNNKDFWNYVQSKTKTRETVMKMVMWYLMA